MTRPLTGQQLDVLRLLAEGLTYPQMAKKLRQSESGVKSLAARMMARLDATNGPNAVHLGWQLGYLTGRET